ncbi:MAG: hypothetical protein GY708_21450 [Actinomycetia bacterium]|nr:hypothetical protein [Actinomycetes bacterium]
MHAEIERHTSSGRPRILRLIVAVFATLLFVSACGGGDDDESSDSADTEVSDGSDSSDGGSDDSDDSTSDDSDDSTSDDEDFTGADSGDWCDWARQFGEQEDAIDDENLGMSEGFERMFNDLLPQLQSAADKAPSEIDDDVDTVIEGFLLLRDKLESVDYNLFELSEEDMAILDRPEFVDANDRVDEYNKTVCGIDEPDSMDSGSSAGMSEADVEALLGSSNRDVYLVPLIAMGLTEDEAECVARSMLLSSDAATPGSPGFAASLESCGLSLDDLADLEGDASLGGLPPDAELATLMAALPVLAGDPALAAYVVQALVEGGIAQASADCIGEVLSSPDAAQTLSDEASVLAALDDCDVTIEQLMAFAG